MAENYWLLSKGAEVSMVSRAADGATCSRILQDVESFARDGLRTLVVGRRRLTANEFLQVDRTLSTAKLAMQDREAAV